MCFLFDSFVVVVCTEVLTEFSVAFEVTIVSAHRTPQVSHESLLCAICFPPMVHGCLWNTYTCICAGGDKDIHSRVAITQRLYDYAASAEQRGLRVIIAGAGGAAHLPG
jgi:phosphoribosylcarboxyaminoimidazole (NCAIR) mutase